MTNEQFIYWLKGFIDYQQLQEQRNPAFTRIKDEIDRLPEFSKSGNSVEVGTGGTGYTNQTATYKTDVPFTYTTAENKKKEIKSYI